MLVAKVCDVVIGVCDNFLIWKIAEQSLLRDPKSCLLLDRYHTVKEAIIERAEVNRVRHRPHTRLV